MSAEAIARTLGGHKAGGSWMARCPAHEDREPSLAIRDGDQGRVLVRCHAGCEQRDVIAILRHRGLWSGSTFVARPSAAVPSNTTEALERSAAAIRLWEGCRGVAGTIVETYLATRGLVVPAAADLRFHPGLKHPRGTWPAMVALVTGVDGRPIGVHRTFLSMDGSGKAPVSPAKMMLGPIRGGSVRLAPAGETLTVGEGIETVLSVMQSTGMPGWAALSTSGMKTLVLPDTVNEVVILADADEPGEAAARTAASRWTRLGRLARIARPTGGKKDFNDLFRDGRLP